VDGRFGAKYATPGWNDIDEVGGIDL
jgi:hypothetical protein